MKTLILLIAIIFNTSLIAGESSGTGPLSSGINHIMIDLGSVQDIIFEDGSYLNPEFDIEVLKTKIVIDVKKQKAFISKRDSVFDILLKSGKYVDISLTNE